MSEKVVVLNSGGFDSIVLLHYVYCNLEYDKEVVSLHFNYGEANKEEQNRVVKKVCEKLGIKSVNISIPKLMWTQNKFYDVKENEPTTKYLEYRNLIFLSYAVSLAESIGAKKIYLATLKSHYYKDTSVSFLNGLNEAIKESGIEIVAPFCEKEKIDLVGYVVDYDIQYNDFFTCDTPVNGIPCGKCNDCLAVKEIMETAKIDHYHKAFVKSGYNYSDPLFQQLLAETPVEEMRLLINNKCQLKCKHCFYGFEETKKPVLSKEQLFNAIVEADKLGIENIHFSGKEPLFDDDLVWYAEQMKNHNLKCTFDLVTNGINVPKYAAKLKECGIKIIHLSVDDIEEANAVRSVHGVTDRALKACCENGIDVDIYVDLHDKNYNRIEEIVDYLLTNYSCIKSFYFRTIRFLGNAEINNLERLTSKQLEEVFFGVKKSAEKYPDKFFQYTINMQYEKEVSESEILAEEVYLNDWYFNPCILDNFVFYVQDCCNRYTNQITLTPDGYLLGCASEVASADYDKISVGTYPEHSLKELIEKGKEVAKTCNDCYLKCGNERKTCSFLY